MDSDGVVAQLVERRVRNAKVRGSTPLGSTRIQRNTACNPQPNERTMEPPVQVTIYHLPGCSRSEAIRAQVEASGVPCETINVLTRPAIMQGLPMSVTTPFPTVRIGGHTLLSATPRRVAAVLKKLRARRRPPPASSSRPSQSHLPGS